MYICSNVCKYALYTTTKMKTLGKSKSLAFLYTNDTGMYCTYFYVYDVYIDMYCI